MSSSLRGAFAATLIVVFGLPALADGDPAQGEKVFKKCLACHSVAVGAPSKVGPNLHDVAGRKTGTFEGFKFSKVMIGMGEEGHVWTPEELDKFLENPKSVAPGTKMTFAGLKKAEERADVIAYLISLHPEGAAAQAAPETEGTPTD